MELYHSTEVTVETKSLTKIGQFYKPLLSGHFKEGPEGVRLIEVHGTGAQSCSRCSRNELCRETRLWAGEIEPKKPYRLNWYWLRIYRVYYLAARRYEFSLWVPSEMFFQHEKGNFVSPSGHVMFYVLYKHQWTTKPFHFNSFFSVKKVFLVWKARFIM